MNSSEVPRPPGGLPLEGIRIVDLSRLIAGNMMTMLLADFGAEVIKVEEPASGDSLRHWLVAGKPVFWKVYGRNKRSVSVDIKQPLGREAVLRLIGTADAVVENFRPGTLEKLGLDVPTMQARRESLITVRISGWGGTGSLAGRAGFGTLIEAMSGFASSNGFADREPILPPLALADMITGLYGAFSLLVALRSRREDGRGQVIDLSLFESLFSTLGPTAAAYEASGEVAPRSGSRSPVAAPRNMYKSSDGRWIALSATTQAMAERLFSSIGRPEMISDSRFADNAARLENIEVLDGIISEYFASRTLDDGVAEMESAGVAVIGVSDISELLRSEYFETRKVVVNGPDNDDVGGVSMHDVVPRLSGSPGSLRLPAPNLGEHNAEILKPLLSDDEWIELEALRVGSEAKNA